MLSLNPWGEEALLKALGLAVPSQLPSFLLLDFQPQGVDLCVWQGEGWEFLLGVGIPIWGDTEHFPTLCMRSSLPVPALASLQSPHPHHLGPPSGAGGSSRPWQGRG